MFLKAPRLLLAAFLALSLLSPALADPHAVVFDDDKPGTYLVTIDAAGGITAVPLKVTVVGKQPQPPDTPDTPDDQAFAEEIKKLAKEALDNGGDKTTAVAIASVYSLVSDGVGDGSIALDKWQSAVKAATDAVLGVREDAAKWTIFRQRVGAALTTLQVQGYLDSKAEVADALEQIAKGIRNAVGFQGTPQNIARLSETARLNWDRDDGKEDGLLDGVNLTQIIELVKLIMELLKLFGAGK
jgi:hypothetical protein